MRLWSVGGVVVEMLGVYILLVKAGAWQDVEQDWPARPTWIRDFGSWLFGLKDPSEYSFFTRAIYSSFTGFICLVLGGLSQIIAIIFA